MVGSQEKESPLRITELETWSGEATELPPHDRARLSIAVKVLGALAVIFILSAATMIFGPAERVERSKEVFDFVKTIVPPIATLVIGFYFRSEGGE